MDDQQAKYLLKVAQLGNITRAAEELYMTQPALSRYISKVEREAGVRIFDRSTSPISLTYAGERYMDTLRRILLLQDELQEELAAISANKKGKLSIGIPPARAAAMLPVFLPEFMREYPNVEVHTVEHNSRQLREDLLRGSVDFAILPQLEPIEGFVCERLYEEEIFLVAMKGSLPDAAWSSAPDGSRVIRPEALKDRPFILLKNGHGIRSALNVMFEFWGIEPNVLLETTNNETAFGLAAAGLGLAIVPKMCVDSQKHYRPIDVFRLSEQGWCWTVYALFHPESPKRFFAARCVETIRSAYEALRKAQKA